jgi:hypothetical protein
MAVHESDAEYNGELHLAQTYAITHLHVVYPVRYFIQTAVLQ